MHSPRKHTYTRRPSAPSQRHLKGPASSQTFTAQSPFCVFNYHYYIHTSGRNHASLHFPNPPQRNPCSTGLIKVATVWPKSIKPSLPIMSNSNNDVSARLAQACALGPTPERLSTGDRPILFMCDAAMVHESDNLFPKRANKTQYSRLLSLSAPSETPIIFSTTELEYQILDSKKEKAKKEALPGVPPAIPNLQGWVRAAEGQGIVKSYPNIRWRRFAHQNFTLNQVRPRRMHHGQR